MALEELKVQYADMMTQVKDLALKAQQIKAQIAKESASGVAIGENLEWKENKYKLRAIDVVPVLELLDEIDGPTGIIVYCNDPALISKLT